MCRLSVERQIPGDDSGGAGLPALLTVDTEFIREQTPGRIQFLCSENSFSRMQDIISYMELLQ